MNFVDKNISIIDQLYDQADIIIRQKIKNEFLNDKVKYSDDTIKSNNQIDYWKGVFSGGEVHGSKDSTFENSIAKLLDFGFNNSYNFFHDQYKKYLDEEFWVDDKSFNSQLIKTVIYPYMIRAGYQDNPRIVHYFMARIETIERTISKYGFDIFTKADQSTKVVFKIDIENEWLPTIYDLYAFSYYQTDDAQLRDRISKIVNYLLDDRFQCIPQKAYIFDKSNRRYYAAGNVYHACFRNDRMLLMMQLLSNVDNIKNNNRFQKELGKLAEYKTDEGFYELDKNLIKEKNNVNYIYSGSHMGLGENRRSKNWCKIESTYWMLKIFKNISVNN